MTVTPTDIAPSHLTAATEALQSAAKAIRDAAGENWTPEQLKAALRTLGDEGLRDLSDAFGDLADAFKGTEAAEWIGHAGFDINDAWGKLGDAADTLNTTENGANR